MSIQWLTADSEVSPNSFNMSAYRMDTGVEADTSKLEDRFATVPEITAVAATPTYRQPDEEELHTSFEQAISDRVLIVNRQLSLKSGPLVHIQRLQLNTTPLQYSNSTAHVVSAPVPRQPWTTLVSSLPTNIWQRSIIFASLALMFMLTGFDLMGLLVLYVH